MTEVIHILYNNMQLGIVFCKRLFTGTPSILNNCNLHKDIFNHAVLSILYLFLCLFKIQFLQNRIIKIDHNHGQFMALRKV